jgi:DNA/RNA-binding domain of Phe-tRNA-synthetase-like protein
MINVSVDKSLSQQIPELMLGIVHAQVLVSKHDDQLWKEIDQCILKISSSYTMDSLYNVRGIKALRDGYKAIGKDPSRYRGSAEALARRIIQGKGLYKVNTIVDINNLVSLESMHSVGSYDLSRISQPIFFRIGGQGESYKGIGKDIINIAELPVFADASGPFGSPTSDSERAMITESTKDLMMVVISFMGKESLDKYIDRIVNLLTRYAGATKDQTETLIVQ